MCDKCATFNVGLQKACHPIKSLKKFQDVRFFKREDEDWIQIGGGPLDLIPRCCRDGHLGIKESRVVLLQPLKPVPYDIIRFVLQKFLINSLVYRLLHTIHTEQNVLYIDGTLAIPLHETVYKELSIIYINKSVLLREG